MSLFGLSRVWFCAGILLAGALQTSNIRAGQPQGSSDKSKSNNAVSAAESSSRPKNKAGNSAPRTASPRSPMPTSGEQDGDRNAYRIGTEDELQISVWREPELSMPVQVRPDGMITLPLLNDIHVVGLTTQELQTLLIEKLKPFLTEPQVTVIVRQIRSRKIYLVGQVGRQGAFPLNGRMTVLQLLAEAGGLAPFAKAGSIYVLRNVNGRQIRIPFNYKKAIQGGNKEGEIVLLPEDVVVVP